jgi:hypothetical protein
MFLLSYFINLYFACRYGTSGKQKRTAHVSISTGGAALTSAGVIQNAVTQLCGVHRIKTGKVTLYLDAVHERKRLESAERRESKRVEGIEEQKRKDAAKGVRFNSAMEETQAQNEQALETHLEMLGHVKGVCCNVYFLQGQYRARKLRAEQEDYSCQRWAQNLGASIQSS